MKFKVDDTPPPDHMFDDTVGDYCEGYCAKCGSTRLDHWVDDTKTKRGYDVIFDAMKRWTGAGIGDDDGES